MKDNLSLTNSNPLLEAPEGMPKSNSTDEEAQTNNQGLQAEDQKQETSENLNQAGTPQPKTIPWPIKKESPEEPTPEKPENAPAFQTISENPPLPKMELPEENPLQMNISPNIAVAPKKSKIPKKFFVGTLVVFFLLASTAIGVFLTGQSQNIGKKAAECEPNTSVECSTGCPSGYTGTCGGHRYCVWKEDGNHVWSDCQCENQSTNCTQNNQGGGGGSTCPTGDGGQAGEGCSNLNKCDIAGGCNAGCCAGDGDCPAGQKCDISNGYCRSGKSCNANSQQEQKCGGSGETCSNLDKCNVQGGCDPACCADDADCPSGERCTVSNGNCSKGKSCAVASSDWFQCSVTNGQEPNLPCGSCSITSLSGGNLNFACELDCGGTASGCPGGTAGSYSITHKQFACKNKGTHACDSSSPDFIGESNLGGPGPWSISGQSSTFGSGTFTVPTCGRVQVDVQMTAKGTEAAGQVVNSGIDCTTNIPTNTPTPPSTTPPGGITEVPGVSCNCVDVKAYDLNWKLLTDSELTKLKEGDAVRFTALGQANQGVITKARFKVNGTMLPETTQKKPGTEEFYVEYAIPAGTTTFNVEAEVYHPNVGWK